MTDPTPIPAPEVDDIDEPAPSLVPADVDEKVATGYAVYDANLQRYIGGVHKTRKDAQVQAKDGPQAHDLTIVRV